MFGNLFIYSNMCLITWWDPFSAHWNFTLFGGFTVTLCHLPLKANFNVGGFNSFVDDATVMTVQRSRDRWLFSLTKQDWCLPWKCRVFCDDDLFQGNIWSAERIRRSVGGLSCTSLLTSILCAIHFSESFHTFSAIEKRLLGGCLRCKTISSSIFGPVFT